MVDNVEFDLLFDTYLEADIAIKDKLIEQGYTEINGFHPERVNNFTTVRIYLLDATFIYCRNPATATEDIVDMFIILKGNLEATVNLHRQLTADKTI